MDAIDMSMFDLGTNLYLNLLFGMFATFFICCWWINNKVKYRDASRALFSLFPTIFGILKSAHLFAPICNYL